MDVSTQPVLNIADAAEVLKHIGSFCARTLQLEITTRTSEGCFICKPADSGRKGILEVKGEINDTGQLHITMLLSRWPAHLPVPVDEIWNHLAGLNSRIRLLPAQLEAGDCYGLRAVLPVHATLMGFARATAFQEELLKISEFAACLQQQIPAPLNEAGLESAYQPVRDVLDPVLPLPAELSSTAAGLQSIFLDIADFLSAGVTVALASHREVEQSFALAGLARALLDRGSSLGWPRHSFIQSKAILEMAEKAPGRVVIPAIRLSMASNPYEVGHEMRTILSALSQAGKPVLFCGSYAELQSILHGGQGADNDPLQPAIFSLQPIDLHLLVVFTVQQVAAKFGGIARLAQQAIAAEVTTVLETVPPSEQRRVLPSLIRHTVQRWKGPSAGGPAPALSLAQRLGQRHETFGGISPRPRACRHVQVQNRYTQVMTDPDLLPRFTQTLLGQDQALRELVLWLRKEAATRPDHQPIRWVAQGMPGTGKSESAVLLARWLSIPYVNIDAVSMPDFHTAASQLLGSGRGIVMSHLPGRLEQVAKHHAGCVVEIIDLDHALPHVRAPLADLWLQVLETGEAQSATGSLFSCANLILAFTMNLPDGADETVRKGISFNNFVSRKDIRQRVLKKLKEMLSSAFISRVGQPILYDPLDAATRALILERTMVQAVQIAARRMGWDEIQVMLTPDVGMALLQELKEGPANQGAREVLERSRSLAANAFLGFFKDNPSLPPRGLRIVTRKEGILDVEAI